jgi:transketolase
MKLLGKKGHIWCIVGDGEMQEGSMWEALNFLQHHKLDNITVIVDNNGLQAMDFVSNVLSHNLVNRLEGWGLETWVCDGHNTDKLQYILKFRPQVLVANTIKGKGYKVMENIPKFHFRVPNGDERLNS